MISEFNLKFTNLISLSYKMLNLVLRNQNKLNKTIFLKTTSKKNNILITNKIYSFNYKNFSNLPSVKTAYK
jgi:hypothetical protein